MNIKLPINVLNFFSEMKVTELCSLILVVVFCFKDFSIKFVELFVANEFFVCAVWLLCSFFGGFSGCTWDIFWNESLFLGNWVLWELRRRSFSLSNIQITTIWNNLKFPSTCLIVTFPFPSKEGLILNYSFRKFLNIFKLQSNLFDINNEYTHIKYKFEILRKK